MKAKYNGKVACQGVGGAYKADVASNLLKKGTTDAAIAEGLNMFNLAFSKCPNSEIIFGGYRFVPKPPLCLVDYFIRYRANIVHSVVKELQS